MASKTASRSKARPRTRKAATRKAATRKAPAPRPRVAEVPAAGDPPVQVPMVPIPDGMTPGQAANIMQIVALIGAREAWSRLILAWVGAGEHYHAARYRAVPDLPAGC